MTVGRPTASRPGSPLYRLTGLLALVGAALLVAGCENSDPTFNHRLLAFGQLTDVSIVQLNRSKAEAAAAALERDFAYLEQVWDPWEPGPLKRTNRLLAEGVTFAAPPSVLPLLREARQHAAASDHLFNPATGRLRHLWGFHVEDPECHSPPSAERIAELVAADPRLSDIDLDDFRLTGHNPAVQLDFTAMVKGYAFDQAVRRLQELGVRNAMISAGGDISAIGSRDGRPWRVGIRSPSGGIFAFVEIDGDESMFTAGDYKRNYTWNGETYHDIIDPRTGYPARGSRLATVIHSKATTADAASTALFIAGPADWHQVASKMGIGYVMLLDADGTLHMNPAMQERIRLLDDSYRVVIGPPLT